MRKSQQLKMEMEIGTISIKLDLFLLSFERTSGGYTKIQHIYEPALYETFYETLA